MLQKKDKTKGSILWGNQPWKILFMGDDNLLYQKLNRYCNKLVFFNKNCQLTKFNYLLDDYENLLQTYDIPLIFFLIKRPNNGEFSLINNLKTKSSYLSPKIITIISKKNVELRTKILENIDIFDYLEIEEINIQQLENKIITALKSYKEEKKYLTKKADKEKKIIFSNDSYE
ncbi:MAG: hybrid sensor histidine kinase/response regulator, partial [Geminocystis sp. GBBB08]|nr:hybrid sensor histidine kinase/response regulator [Geminocystis sp. GBBB08]